MEVTMRLLQVARAIERLSARDMDRLTKVIYPDGGYDAERYRMMVKLLKFSDSIVNQPQPE